MSGRNGKKKFDRENLVVESKLNYLERTINRWIKPDSNVLCAGDIEPKIEGKKTKSPLFETPSGTRRRLRGGGGGKEFKKKKKRSTAGRRSCRYLMGARNLYTRVLWALVRAPCVRARNYTGRHGPVTGDGAKIEFRRRRFSSLSNRQNFRARRTRKRPALPRRIKVMNEKFFFLPVRPSW